MSGLDLDSREDQRAWGGSPTCRAGANATSSSHALDPLFGLAASEEEYEARNRLKTNVGASAVEGWVGRDVSRYIPGLYWRTLISTSLLEKHGVPVPALEAIAKGHRELHGARQHLFGFSDRPEDWQSRHAGSASIAGVFDVDRIRQELAGARNVLEASTLLARWP